MLDFSLAFDIQLLAILNGEEKEVEKKRTSLTQSSKKKSFGSAHQKKILVLIQFSCHFLCLVSKQEESQTVIMPRNL